MKPAKISSKDGKKRTLSVTEFKAKCLSLFEQSRKRGMEFTITKKGEPIAVVLPFNPPKKSESLFGIMKGKCKITGDIVNFDTSDLWEALKA